MKNINFNLQQKISSFIQGSIAKITSGFFDQFGDFISQVFKLINELQVSWISVFWLFIKRLVNFGL